MIDVQGAEPPRPGSHARERREQRSGIGAAAEGDAEREVRKGGQQLLEAPAEPARAEVLRSGAHRPSVASQGAFSENTPKEAIFAARAARS